MDDEEIQRKIADYEARIAEINATLKAVEAKGCFRSLKQIADSDPWTIWYRAFRQGEVGFEDKPPPYTGKRFSYEEATEIIDQHRQMQAVLKKWHKNF